MATAPIAPANDAVEQAIIGDFVTLDPNEIEIGERLREIDDAWAWALGLSMKTDGQIHPIHVCKGPNGWLLAGPGGHRLTGACKVGIAIDAKIVSPDRLGQRRREAAENVFRRKNDPIERAAAIAELVRVHKLARGIDPAKDGRSASAQARWQKALENEADDTKATMTLVYGWTDELAETIGVSPSLIKRDLYLYRRLAPSLIARIRADRHPILGNAGQLRALAKLETAEQGRVVDLLLDSSADRPIKTVADAVARLSGPKQIQAPDQKRLNTILGTLKRMGATERTALFQSAEFHGLIPVEARRLLAPMLRDGGEVENVG